MYECAHKCMRPLQYRSNIVYEMTRSYGVCLYVSTIHVYTVRHNVVCICHAQGPIGLYLRNKHSSSSSSSSSSMSKTSLIPVAMCRRSVY